MQYPYFIVSAERTNRTRDQNTLCMMLAARIVQARGGVKCCNVRGAYDGTPEHSLALSGPNAESLAMMISKVFSQESYLEVLGHSDARLWTPDGRIIAVFTQRLDATADNYTEIDGDRFTFAA